MTFTGKRIIINSGRFILNTGEEVDEMAVSYRKLWKLLIDKDMKKKDLRVASGISTNALAKLGKNDRVGTDVLEKVCLALSCDVGDIMEVVDENEAHDDNFQGGYTNER